MFGIAPRPRAELFDANLVEVASFHESFGDISALLSALQLPSFCAALLTETGGKLGNSSRLSRIGEELGWAINQRRPDLASPDYLRNAVNAYFYISPMTLPTSGPDSSLNAEPHNFSRVFTGGFFDALVAMIARTQDPPDIGTIQAVGLDAARLLVSAVKAAPITTDYYFQIASAMIGSDLAVDSATGKPGPNTGKYADCLRGAFVRRGILPVAALAVAGTPPVPRPAATTAAVTAAAAPLSYSLDLPAQQFGFSEGTLSVESTTPRAQSTVAPAFAAVNRDNSGGNLSRFITYLFQRGRVELDDTAKAKSVMGHSQSRKTHTVSVENGQMRLRRKCFDCGFD